MNLNNQQQEAVYSLDKRLLVLAGAGSGKTRVITERIRYFIEEISLPANQILALTFTNKAAKEMQERAVALSEHAKESYFSTFHSFGSHFLRQYAHLLGLTRYFSIYDDQDQLSHLKRLYPHEPQNQLMEWRHYINRAKDYALDFDEFANIYQNAQDFKQVFQNYQATLLLNNAVDFGDLIILPLQILEQYPDIRHITRERWQAILVDEYQDTNQAQAKLLQKLIDPKHFLTVVGDDDQSIYAFRGANSQAILDFDQEFPGTTIIKLEENYRSQPSILACANQLISHNKQRLGKNLFTQQQKMSPVEIHLFPTEEAEVLWICDFLLDNKQPELQYAILYRTNAQSRLFEKIFTQASLPYRLVGSIRFFEREEIKTALAALTLLLNPSDQTAFIRISSTPSRGIGKTSLQRIFAKHLELKDNSTEILTSANEAKLGAKARQSILILTELYHQFTQQLETDLELSSLYINMMHQLGLFEYYTTKDGIDGSDRLANLQELANALSYYGTGKNALLQFIESVQLNISDENKGNQTANISLITIHNTKGLEYDAVFVTGMEQHLFPKIDLYSRHFEEELEEERRLCYVALTRAREHLYLTHAQTRRVYGKVYKQEPSQFLTELLTPKHTQTISHIPAVQNHTVTPIFTIGQWVYDEELGVGKIISLRYSKAGHLVLEIQFKEGLHKFLPQFRYLEPIIIDNDPF